MRCALLAKDLMPPATFERKRAKRQAEILAHREGHAALKSGHALSFGVDHPACENERRSVLKDLR
ncbi:MAG TPA: hypothetical protein VEN28_13545 [Burkholderiaceae bacterium]|nr:hypothetical protein [Burkholderiaceae bacterium]